MDVADIEKFFNENFFKKLSGGAKQKLSKDYFLHGVPESAYEPTTSTSGDSGDRFSGPIFYADKAKKKDPFRYEKPFFAVIFKQYQL